MVLLFMLLVIDSGRLYLEQRSLQRVADYGCVGSGKSGGNCIDGSAKLYVEQSANLNGFIPDSVQTVTPTCGTLKTGSDQVRVFIL